MVERKIQLKMKPLPDPMKIVIYVCSFLLLISLSESARAEQVQMMNREGKPIEDLYVALKSNSNLSGKIISPDTRVLHINKPILVRMAGRTFLTGDYLRYWERSEPGGIKKVSRVWFDFFEVNVFTENEVDLETGQQVAKQSDQSSGTETSKPRIEDE